MRESPLALLMLFSISLRRVRWCGLARSRALSIPMVFGDYFFFFFSSRRRHTRSDRDWSSDVCSSDLIIAVGGVVAAGRIGKKLIATVGGIVRTGRVVKQRIAAAGCVARTSGHVFHRGIPVGGVECAAQRQIACPSRKEVTVWRIRSKQQRCSRVNRCRGGQT